MNKLCGGLFVILRGVLVVCLLHKLCGGQDVEVKTFLAFCLVNLQNAPLDIAGVFCLSKPYHRIVLASFMGSHALMKCVVIFVSQGNVQSFPG